MIDVELYDLKTGNIFNFKSKKECASFLKIDYKKFANASSYNPSKIFKKRYSLVNQPIIKPKVKREKRHGEYNEWKLLRFAEFPRIIVSETALPFYDKDKFEVLKKATYRYYGKKNSSVWIDDENTSNNNFIRSKSRLQLYIKTEKEEPFSYVYDFLDKMSELIRELKNMNDGENNNGYEE